MHVKPIGGARPILCSLLAAACIALPALVAGTAAAAPSPTISATPSTDLNPEGQFVTVTGTGFTPGIELFVLQCSSTSAQDHTCNSIGMQKVTTDASGSFRANPMRVTARFGATDCLQVQCAMKTSAVANHSQNRGDDLSVNISFRSAAPATPAPTTAPPPTAAPSTTAAPTQAPTTAATATSTTAPPTTLVPTTAPQTSSTSVALAPPTTPDAQQSNESSGSPILWIAGIALVVGAGGVAAFLFNRRPPTQKDNP